MSVALQTAEVEVYSVAKLQPSANPTMQRIGEDPIPRVMVVCTGDQVQQIQFQCELASAPHVGQRLTVSIAAHTTFGDPLYSSQDGGSIPISALRGE